MVDEKKTRASAKPPKARRKAEDLTPEEIAVVKRVGKNIHDIRKSKKLTQAKLAELCKLEPVSISYIETGDRRPPVLTLYKIAKNLGCPLAQLFEGVE